MDTRENKYDYQLDSQVLQERKKTLLEELRLINSICNNPEDRNLNQYYEQIRKSCIKEHFFMRDFLNQVSLPLDDWYPSDPEGFGDYTCNVVDDIYHFKFKRLLPRKLDISYNLSKEEQKYLRYQLISDYRRCNQKYACLINKSLLDEPVMLLFIHNYKNKTIYDLDNLEYKYFIDTVLVEGGFIKNDSPDKLSVISTSFRKCDCDYSEAYLGNQKAILEILQRRQLNNGKSKKE